MIYMVNAQAREKFLSLRKSTRMDIAASIEEVCIESFICESL